MQEAGWHRVSRGRRRPWHAPASSSREGLSLQQRVLGQRAFPLTPWCEPGWSPPPYVSPSHEPDGSECDSCSEYHAESWWIRRFYDPYDDDWWSYDWDYD